MTRYFVHLVHSNSKGALELGVSCLGFEISRGTTKRIGGGVVDSAKIDGYMDWINTTKTIWGIGLFIVRSIPWYEWYSGWTRQYDVVTL